MALVGIAVWNFFNMIVFANIRFGNKGFLKIMFIAYCRPLEAKEMASSFIILI